MNGAVILMGVSGTGKSTIGGDLAAALGARFIEGDDLHPPANKAKMRRGIPLDDDDRYPWLQAIGNVMCAVEGAVPPVVACSALKRSYRDLLRTHDPRARFVCLLADEDVLRLRMAHRSHEFMNPSLLVSQLATLEPLGLDERGVTVDSSTTSAAAVREILHRLPNLTRATYCQETSR